jgi:dynein heavy chain
MRLEKNLDPNPIQIMLKELVFKFKDAMPIVVAFRNQNLNKETHWVEIKKLVDKDFEVDTEDFTLKSLLDLEMNQFKDDIVQISI